MAVPRISTDNGRIRMVEERTMKNTILALVLFLASLTAACGATTWEECECLYAGYQASGQVRTGGYFAEVCPSKEWADAEEAARAHCPTFFEERELVPAGCVCTCTTSARSCSPNTLEN